ncbi:MAG TPA: winged helix-turn-helix domain-containing protein [Thermoanaerobaculia bacterium]|nr:winged helix-turn-helix domain-containing protein [Thermoanaerobaculia bacterium]
MLLRRAALEGIAAGAIDLAFRRWQRPRVRAGTRLRTAVGLVEVTGVEVVDPDRVTPEQAGRAGYPSVAALRSELDRYGDAPVHRVGLRFAGDDPRIALRQSADLDPEAHAGVSRRLDRLDARSRDGAWTRAVLRAIAEQPGRRAADLAAACGVETRPFKARVRRLKELGLTESLEVGYRLSPRGEAYLAAEHSTSA